MKVLMVCMVWLAVALAMPVAEENIAAPAIAEVKAESLNAEKPQADAASVTQVKSESPVAPEKKEEPVQIVTPSSGLAKSADIVPKAAPVTEVQPEAAATIEKAKPEEKKPEESLLPEKPQEEKAKELKTLDKEADPKLEENKTEEKKPEEKKPEEKTSEERSAITAATVSEVPKESPKAIIAEPSIDVVSAAKNPAAIADDVVDPAALIPDQKPETPVELAKIAPVEKKDESSEKKPEEVKPDQKLADTTVTVSAKPVSDAVAAEPKSEKPLDAPADDSLRVVRDTVDDQKAAASSEPAKTEAPTVTEQKASAEEKPEASPVKKDEPVIANDAEKPKVEERSNAVAKSDKPEEAKPELVEAAISTEKSVIASVSSSNASPKIVAETVVIDELKHNPTEVKPDSKSVEKPLGDAPSAASSEESSENSSAEKKSESKESSEEESMEVTKAPAKSR